MCGTSHSHESPFRNVFVLALLLSLLSSLTFTFIALMMNANDDETESWSLHHCLIAIIAIMAIILLLGPLQFSLAKGCLR